MLIEVGFEHRFVEQEALELMVGRVGGLLGSCPSFSGPPITVGRRWSSSLITILPSFGRFL